MQKTKVIMQDKAATVILMLRPLSRLTHVTASVTARVSVWQHESAQVSVCDEEIIFLYIYCIGLFLEGSLVCPREKVTLYGCGSLI